MEKDLGSLINFAERMLREKQWEKAIYALIALKKETPDDEHIRLQLVKAYVGDTIELLSGEVSPNVDLMAISNLNEALKFSPEPEVKISRALKSARGWIEQEELYAASKVGLYAAAKELLEAVLRELEPDRKVVIIYRKSEIGPWNNWGVSKI